MMKPAKMQKIRLVALTSVARPLLAELHRLGMVEIRRFECEGFETGKTMEIYDSISRNLVRLRAIKSMLGLKGKYPQDLEVDLDTTLQKAESFRIDEGLREKHALMDKYNNQISNLQSKLKDVQMVSGFDIDFSELDSEHLSFLVGHLPESKFSLIAKDLKGATMDSKISGRERVLVVAYPKEDAHVETILGKHGVALIDTEGFSTPAKTKVQIQKEIKDITEKRDKIRNEIDALSKKYGEDVIKLEYILSLWGDRAVMTKEMGFANSTFILEGWVNANEEEHVKNTLEAKFGTKVLVEAIPQKKGESVPVVLNNPKQTYPAEFLVRMFSLPKHTELDPTIILYITVPLIYGMMLGDVIYGLISFFVASFLMTKWKKGGLGYGAASIWRFSALAGIIFGLFFNEWMGMTLYQLLEHFQAWGIINLANWGITGPIYNGFSRSHQVPLLLGMSILLGVVHIALGFLLGAINAWNEGHKKHAVAKISWIFIEIGGLLAVCSMMFGLFSPEVGTIGLGILGVSVAVMAFTEGALGLMEIPALLGNILSYARIAAVGLVGVLLAELINHTFIPTPDQGIVFALLMLPLLALLHFANMGLAMVECIIQGGRLNLVEFYGKFFHGGGAEFTPFKIKQKK